MTAAQAHDHLDAEGHLSSSILLWVRDDQPRRTGMDYWRGPHSGIIAATPGLLEYRRIHLAEETPDAGRRSAPTSRRPSPPTDGSTGSPR